MADQDYPTLYADLEASAQRTRAAALAFEHILGGPEADQVPVNNWGDQPTIAARVKARMDALMEAVDSAAEGVKRFAGVHTTAPTTRTDGTGLQSGDEYQNSSNGLRYSWSGSAWIVLNASVQQLTQQLSSSTGAASIGRGTGTVSSALDTIDAEITDLQARLTEQSFTVVSKFADLAALDTAKITKALTLGYYDMGDGGSAEYQFTNNKWVLIPRAEGVNVRQFGAKGDATFDDTTAIQAALNACPVVHIPADMICKVTATLKYRPDQIIKGAGPEKSRIWRNTVYGDTFALYDPLQNTGALQVDGIWFFHQYIFADAAGNTSGTYTAGTSVSILNRSPNDCHIRILRGQNVRLSNCWFYGMGFQVYFLDTTVMWVDKCLNNGMWDSSIAALQDTVAGYYGDVSSVNGRNGLLYFTGNHIGGWGPSAPSNVTIGNVTSSKTLNAGMKWGIYLASAERFTITDNYIGGQSEQSIRIQAKGIVAHGIIKGNMLDAARNYSIMLDSAASSVFPSFIRIVENTGVGYGIDRGFLWVYDSGQPYSAAYLTVANNAVQYYYQAAMRFEKVKGLRLHDNDIIAYNSDTVSKNADGTTMADPYTQAGAVCDANCSFVRSYDNMWGGSVNAPGGANGCKWGIYFYSATNNRASNEDNYGFGVAGGGTVGGLAAQTYPTSVA